MTAPFATLVLFGATGDLARRMLLPSLYNLHRDRLLPEDFRVLAAGRGEQDDAGFRAALEQQLSRGETWDPSTGAAFLACVDYLRVSLDQPGDYDVLAERLAYRRARGVAYYLSTPPALFAAAVEGLRAAGLTGPECRVAMEKPIGHDLASAVAVNAALARAVPEEQVFRVDHYLGKETVQNLLVLRFANALWEPLWNARSIKHVQITVAETVGLEGRAGYYEGVGALSDMVQNHMLQLLALVAMEPPAAYTPAAVRDEKVKVLRSLRPFTAEMADTHSVKGQYRAGAIAGIAVSGYRDELGRESGTETFVALKTFVDNWRWHGVPFYLRTGKRLPSRRSEIVIQFHAVPHQIFRPRGAGLQPNSLVIAIQPEEAISLLTMAKEPGLDRAGLAFREVALDVSLSGSGRRRIAYERLLLDLIAGDATLFVRADEVEAAWRWIDSIHAAWRDAGTKVKGYMAGSWGPAGAIGLIERDGASWHD